MTALKLKSSGKVRDSYELEGREDILVMVATDRISAYDTVMSQGVPGKGVILTKMSDYWFALLSDVVPTQQTTSDGIDLPELWVDRTTIVRRGEMIPIECVVRGYLAGSGYEEYTKTDKVHGIDVPRGLRLGSRLPAPIFTPTTKAEVGHDVPLAPGQITDMIGSELARELERLSVEIYVRARDHAETKGLIIADTKFEFGYIDGKLSLCDEVLTPDSSRYWDPMNHRANGEPMQFDKQILRDWLGETSWDRISPPPDMPQELIDRIVRSYLEIWHRLAGEDVVESASQLPEEAYMGIVFEQRS